jgi:hypothetical protein
LRCLRCFAQSTNTIIDEIIYKRAIKGDGIPIRTEEARASVAMTTGIVRNHLKNVTNFVFIAESPYLYA